MKEIWKPITGYKGFYEVSNLGNVKSLPRWDKAKAGWTRYNKGRILKLAKQPKSDDPNDYYLLVGLCKNAIERQWRVHILVAIEFVDNPNNFKEVNHLDLVKYHNWATNLEWSNSAEQLSHHSINRIKKTSKYIGVSWAKIDQKWCAQIQVKGKKIMLGYFNNEEEAQQKYLAALKQYEVKNKYATF